MGLGEIKKREIKTSTKAPAIRPHISESSLFVKKPNKIAVIASTEIRIPLNINSFLKFKFFKLPEQFLFSRLTLWLWPPYP